MKLRKSAICIFLAFAMLVSMSVCSLAVAPQDMDIVAGEITFVKTVVDGENKVQAQCLVRDLTGQGRSAMLVAASYDDDGNLVEIWGNPDATGANKILSTYAVTDDNAKTVKAFVWDPTTNRPLTPTAIYKDEGYDFNAALSKLSITFDGVDFAEYMGTAFDPATTNYTKALEAGSQIPVVKATSKDNASDVIVLTEGNKTTITVDHSAGYTMQTVSGTVPSGTTADVQRADYGAYTRTFVINYTGDNLVAAKQPADNFTVLASDMTDYVKGFDIFDYDPATGSSVPGSKFWSDTVWHAFKAHHPTFGLKGLQTIRPSWNLITNGKKPVTYWTTNDAYCSFKVNQPSEILIFVHGKSGQWNYYTNYCPESEKRDWVTISDIGASGHLWANNFTHSAGSGTVFGGGCTLSVKYAAEGETVNIYAPANGWIPYYIFVRPLA